MWSIFIDNCLCPNLMVQWFPCPPLGEYFHSCVQEWDAEGAFQIYNINFKNPEILTRNLWANTMFKTLLFLHSKANLTCPIIFS